jgi:hypothetical protein
VTTHITVDKKQAWRDAEQLANGEFMEDPDDREPFIEEVPTHPEDGDEDAPTLRIVMGGEYTMAEIPPIGNEANWDYANAVQRAGYHIMGLLQENQMLLAAQGKDVAEQRVKLLVALKELRDWCNYVVPRVRTLMGSEKTELPPAIAKANAVIAECDAKEPADGT